MTLMPVRGWFGISSSSPTDKWHLRRHHGHELDIGIERQAGHVQDCAHYVRDVDSWLDLDVPVRLHDPLDHTLRHFGGRVADVDLATRHVVLSALQEWRPEQSGDRVLRH